MEDIHMDDNFSLRIECPICANHGNINIPREKIIHTGKGLSSILIENSCICEHTFIVYVDKNGIMRGAQSPDHKLKFNSMDENYVNQTYEVLNILYDEEIFCKLFRTALLNNEICIITENKSLYNLKDIFGKIFTDKYKEKVIITSMIEYNNEVRKRLLSPEFQNFITVNLDYRTIIQQPYNKSFRKKDFNLEMSILNEIKKNVLNDQILINTLKSKYDDIFDALIEMKDLIEKNVLSSRSKIDAWIQKLLIKNLKLEAEIVYEILRKQFNIIIV